MAGSALKERQNHVLKGHAKMIPPYGRRRTWRRQVGFLNSQVTDYLGMSSLRHYGVVVQSGPPASSQPSSPSGGGAPGTAIELVNVVGPALAAGADADSGAPGLVIPGPGVAGVSLTVPPGQSVALAGQPATAVTGLFDAIAGLGRPRSGRVLVDGIAVSELSRAQLDRYRARRGLVSPRFSLLPSLSVVDNVLAAPPVDRTRPPSADRARRLLELAGAAGLAGPVRRLSAEQQWRIMIARALVSSPRLVLAEDPAAGLDPAAADRVLDVLMDAHAMFGFTLLLTAVRPATAVRCQRRVQLAADKVVEDELNDGDDAWTRSRIDRIG
jgi:predicted ABC-type transport system involved in lysophospholipase L1 biosynthesis ATPase subunit